MQDLEWVDNVQEIPFTVPALTLNIFYFLLTLRFVTTLILGLDAYVDFDCAMLSMDFIFIANHLWAIFVFYRLSDRKKIRSVFIAGPRELFFYFISIITLFTDASIPLVVSSDVCEQCFACLNSKGCDLGFVGIMKSIDRATCWIALICFLLVGDSITEPSIISVYAGVMWLCFVLWYPQFVMNEILKSSDTSEHWDWAHVFCFVDLVVLLKLLPFLLEKFWMKFWRPEAFLHSYTYQRLDHNIRSPTMPNYTRMIFISLQYIHIFSCIVNLAFIDPKISTLKFTDHKTLYIILEVSFILHHLYSLYCILRFRSGLIPLHVKPSNMRVMLKLFLLFLILFTDTGAQIFLTDVVQSRGFEAASAKYFAAVDRASFWILNIAFVLFADSLIEDSLVYHFTLSMFLCCVSFFLIFVVPSFLPPSETGDPMKIKLAKTNFIIFVTVMTYLIEQYWQKFFHPKCSIHQIHKLDISRRHAYSHAVRQSLIFNAHSENPTFLVQTHI